MLMAANNSQLNSGESNSLILERHFTDPYYSNGDQFGYNSAINGDTLVVSAIREDSNGDPEDNSVNNSGAIYSFQRESGNWVLKQFLKAPVPTPNAHFGYTLDLYDDVLVVGLKETFTVTGQSSGTARTTGNGVVYVFRQQNSLWELEATLKPSRPFHSDKYGSTLAVSGDTIVVGDPEEDNDGNLTPTQYRNEEYGAVYVYVWSGTDWVEQAYLKASPLYRRIYFGAGVAIDGDRIAISASSSDLSGKTTFYIFQRNGTAWNQEAFLAANYTKSGNSEPTGSIAIDGDRFIARLIGAIDDSGNVTGAIVVFKHNAGSWNQEQLIFAPNFQEGVFFGWDIAIEGDLIVASAINETLGSSTGVGYIYFFTRHNNIWSLHSSRHASSPESHDRFGFSLSLNGEKLAVGAIRSTVYTADLPHRPGFVDVFNLAPELHLRGKGEPIAAGDNTPSPLDGSDFGSVDVGQSLSQSFTISNTGLSTLTISEISISGPAADAFALAPMSLPITLALGDASSFQLNFSPEQGFLLNATVTIQSNDPNQSSFSFAVQGTAIGGPATATIDPSATVKPSATPLPSATVKPSATPLPTATSQASLIPEGHITAPNADIGDRFGQDIAIDGDTLVIGSSNEDSNGDPNDNNSNSGLKT
jgi:hypothetical protein